MGHTLDSWDVFISQERAFFKGIRVFSNEFLQSGSREGRKCAVDCAASLTSIFLLNRMHTLYELERLGNEDANSYADVSTIAERLHEARKAVFHGMQHVLNKADLIDRSVAQNCRTVLKQAPSGLCLTFTSPQKLSRRDRVSIKNQYVDRVRLALTDLEDLLSGGVCPCCKTVIRVGDLEDDGETEKKPDIEERGPVEKEEAGPELPDDYMANKQLILDLQEKIKALELTVAKQKEDMVRADQMYEKAKQKLEHTERDNEKLKHRIEKLTAEGKNRQKIIQSMEKLFGQTVKVTEKKKLDGPEKKAEKAAPEKATAEKAAAEKAAAEKAASEKAAAEKAAAGKAAAGKAASEKAEAEKAGAEKAASEKAAAEHLSSDVEKLLTSDAEPKPSSDTGIGRIEPSGEGADSEGEEQPKVDSTSDTGELIGDAHMMEDMAKRSAAHKQHISSLMIRRGYQDYKVKMLQDLVADLEKKIRELQGLYDESLRRIEELKAEGELPRQENAQPKVEDEDDRNSGDQAADALASATQQISDLQALVERLQKEKKELLEENAMLKNEIKRLNLALEALQLKYDLLLKRMNARKRSGGDEEESDFEYSDDDGPKGPRFGAGFQVKKSGRKMKFRLRGVFDRLYKDARERLHRLAELQTKISTASMEQMLKVLEAVQKAFIFFPRETVDDVDKVCDYVLRQFKERRSPKRSPSPNRFPSPGSNSHMRFSPNHPPGIMCGRMTSPNYTRPPNDVLMASEAVLRPVVAQDFSMSQRQRYEKSKNSLRTSVSVILPCVKDEAGLASLLEDHHTTSPRAMIQKTIRMHYGTELAQPNHNMHDIMSIPKGEHHGGGGGGDTGSPNDGGPNNNGLRRTGLRGMIHSRQRDRIGGGQQKGRICRGRPNSAAELMRGHLGWENYKSPSVDDVRPQSAI